MRVTSGSAILHSTSIKSDDASMVAVATTEDDDSVTEANEDSRPPTPPAERRESSGMDRKTSAVLSRDSVSTRGPQSLSHLPLEGTMKAKGIELDLDQSWQRALLHELEKNDGEVKQKEDKQRPELVLLRHSESQDYACEVDQDDVTIGTNASSTVPVKPQSIHRTSLYLKEGLFDDESSLGRMDGLKICQSAPNSQTQFEHEDRRDESPYGETTPKANHRNREDIVEEKVCDGSVKPIPDQLPRNRNHSKQQPLPIHRAHAIGDEIQQPFLEIELSGDSESNLLPDSTSSSCFCWGYNVLDFWLPPHTPQYRRKRHPRTLSPAKLDYILEEVFEVNHKEQKGDVSPHRADPTGSYTEHGYR